MSHVDEGTLHAYLDGELAPSERAELERHLSVCVPCRSAMAEARDFLSASDGMIQALDVAAPAPSTTRPVTTRPIIPFRTLAWAASLVAAVGLGYSLRSAPTETEATPQAIPEGNVRTDLPAPAIVEAAPNSNDARPRPEPQRLAQNQARRDAAAPVTDQKSAAQAHDEAVDRLDAAGAAAGIAAQPAPASAGAPSSPVAGRAVRATPPSTIAMVEGVPVDTTAAHRAFGPPHPPAPRRITMDEAVAHLGGTIRLIDGFTPQRVELLAGVDVTGADPNREVVRIYYEEPDLGLVTLDQQRPGPSFSSLRPQGEVAPESVTVAQAPSPSSARILSDGRTAIASLTWRADGTWLSLTSRLTKDQMASLQARVK